MQWSSDAIREAREARGWSQQELADALTTHVRTSKHAIQSWEQGKTAPAGRRVAALDAVLAAGSVFSPPQLLASLSAAELQTLLAHIPDALIVQDIARRLATASPTRDIGDRVADFADMPDGLADNHPQGGGDVAHG